MIAVIQKRDDVMFIYRSLMRHALYQAIIGIRGKQSII
jgi:hypothetical protein